MIDQQKHWEETCQGVVTLLPCDLAWLLAADDDSLHSRAVFSARGAETGNQFVRMATGGVFSPYSVPLSVENNPVVKAAWRAEPKVNLVADQVRQMTGGERLAEAMIQTGLTVLHFIPLRLSALVGVLIAGGQTPLDASPRAAQVLQVVQRQTAESIERALLVQNLARREEEMRAEQTFRKMVLDSMGDSLVILDEEARITYVNNRLLSITGYMRKELQNVSIGQLFHPQGREALVEKLKRGARATVSFYQQLITKAGRVVPVQMSRATLPPPTGSGQGTILVLTDLTDQKAREQLLEKQGERLRALNRAGQMLASAVVLEDVLARILDITPELVDCVNVAVLMPFGEQQDALRTVAVQGPQAEMMMDITVRLGEGIAGRTAKERRPLLISKIEPSENFVRPGNSVLAVPMLAAEKLVGVLEVINKTEGAFSQDDVGVLENLGSAAAVAIEKARLFDETQRRVSELSTLLEASAAVSSTLDIKNVLELITRDLRETLKVSRCTIAAWDRETNELRVLAEASNAIWARDRGPERLLASLLFGTGMLREGKSVVARQRDPHLNPRVREYLAGMGMTSVMLTPVRFTRDMLGVIELYKVNDSPPFTPQMLRAVEEAIIAWEREDRPIEAEISVDELTDLSRELNRACRASWCVISLWSPAQRRAAAIRELGFAVWDDQASAGSPFRLKDYPTMARSIQHGMPVTLYSGLLRDDPNERAIMQRMGAYTGLVTPLLARGEAIGVVKLLDTDPDRTFDLAEISLCQGIANVVANALENARLFQSLEKRAADLEAAYNELREADKLKDSLFSNISHEIKTPLHKMMLQVDLIGQEYLGPLSPEQRDGMKALTGWGMEMARLVNDMVALHALSDQSMNFQPVRLDTLLGHAVERVRYRASQAKIQIMAHLPPTLPSVRADNQALADALDRLLDNAIKFSPNANRINVRAREVEGGLVEIAVQDFGIGIPSSEYGKIFERGYQVDKGINRRFGGAGLGLALCKQIVTAHGGKIWVESEPGKGSTFYLTIARA